MNEKRNPLISIVKYVMVALEVLGIPQRIKDLEQRPSSVSVGAGSGSGGGTGDLTEATADELYVNVDGDTMTGDLEFDTSSDGIILKSGTSAITAGMPIGLLLALTYTDTVASGMKRWKLSVNDSGNLITTEL